MIQKLKQLIFATERELRVKVIITVVGILLQLTILIDVPFILPGLAYMWGWSFIKGWFGITAFVTIFSGSLLRSIFIVMAFLIIAAIVGMFYGFIGVVRYAYLLIVKFFGAKQSKV